MTDEELAARIQSQCTRDTDSGCILWTGSTDGRGYGTIYADRKTVRVHRLVWMQENGPIPTGLVIMHKCDNPRCIRLDHLVPGTQAENMADMYTKGRDRNGNESKATCPKGHPYSDENTYIDRRGRRQCITCNYARQKAYKAARGLCRHYLTQQTADEIHAALGKGESQRSIASRFGVSQDTVSMINMGKWRERQYWTLDAQSVTNV